MRASVLQPVESVDEGSTDHDAVLAALEGADLGRLADRVAEHLRAAGIGFGDGQFRLDPVPRVIAADEWAAVSRGVAQRARALAAFVADVYGERRIVTAGLIDADTIESADCHEPWLRGVIAPAAGFVAGLDVVRCADGALRVLEDNCRTPSGLAYAIAARTAIASCVLDPPANCVDPRAGIGQLGEALRAAAPEGVDEPQIALLSDGPANSAWYEHRTLAAELGIPLVTPGDLLVTRGRLHARTGNGTPREVHVIYRRTEEDRLQGRDGRPTWVADALLEPLRQGRLTVVNPFGAGVADDKLVHAYVEEMVRFYLGEEPLLESVATYDLGDPDVCAELLPRLDELVVKPRTGHGGDGVVICGRTARERLERVRAAIEANPGGYVAQELVALSTHPTVCDGELAPRHVDLRPFAIGGEAAPCALTRVALDAGSMVVNSSQNGGAKDTWLLR